MLKLYSLYTPQVLASNTSPWLIWYCSNNQSKHHLLWIYKFLTTANVYYNNNNTTESHRHYTTQQHTTQFSSAHIAYIHFYTSARCVSCLCIILWYPRALYIQTSCSGTSGATQLQHTQKGLSNILVSTLHRYWQLPHLSTEVQIIRCSMYCVQDITRYKHIYISWVATKSPPVHHQWHIV